MSAIFSGIRHEKGFSLIEVIIIIIVSSIAFTMIFRYFGPYITDSSIPVHRLRHSAELKQTAERITEYYRQDTAADLNALKDSLNNDPGSYGSNFSVVYNGFVKFVSRNDTTLSGGDTEDMLKVKIQHDDTNETLTLLFVRQ